MIWPSTPYINLCLKSKIKSKVPKSKFLNTPPSPPSSKPISTPTLASSNSEYHPPYLESHELRFWRKLPPQPQRQPRAGGAPTLQQHHSNHKSNERLCFSGGYIEFGGEREVRGLRVRGDDKQGSIGIRGKDRLDRNGVVVGERERVGIRGEKFPIDEVAREENVVVM